MVNQLRTEKIGDRLSREAGLNTLDLVREPVVPSIPAATTDPVSLQSTVQAMKSVLDLGTGKTGTILDAWITLRDLIDTGALVLGVGNSNTSGNTPVLSPPSSTGYVSTLPVYATPPTVTGFAAAGNLKTIFLTWTPLFWQNFAYYEIWRATSNNLGVAVRIGTTTDQSFEDGSGTYGVTYFYWIRAVNVDGTLGAFNAGVSSGTQAGIAQVAGVDLSDLVVTAAKLSQGTYPNINLVPNFGAEDGTSAWSTAWDTGLGTFTNDTSIKTGGSQSFKLTKTSGQRTGAGCFAFPVIPGETYAWRLKWRGSSAFGSSHYVRMYEKTSYPTGGIVTSSNQTSITDVVSTGAITTSFVEVKGTYVVPAGVLWVSLGVLNDSASTNLDLYWDDVSVGRQITAEFLAANSIAVGTAAIQNAAIVNAMIANATIQDAKIVNLDGSKINAASITATQIAAHTITATQIAAATLTATEIASHTITATNIAASTITATEIAAGTITAAKMATGTITAASGIVNDLSASVITTGSLSGQTITGGQIQTASSGKRIVLNESGDDEATFYADRGDGTIEALATIGINSNGTDNVIHLVGSANSARVGMQATASTKVAVLGITTSGVAAVQGITGTTVGVLGSSTSSGDGIQGSSSSSGRGGAFSSSSGYGVVAQGNSTKAPLQLIASAAPSGVAQGAFYFNSSDNHPYCANGSAWNKIALFSDLPAPPPPTCFPAGALVLMGDYSWKRIERIKVDELVWSPFGPTKVVEAYRTHLGKRRMMAFPDGHTWSEEHAYWTRKEGKQWWGTASRKLWIREAKMGYIGGLKDNNSIRDLENCDFAHLSGWVRPVISIVKSSPDTKLYLPLTGGPPIVVNSYLVGAGVNEGGCEYDKLDWDEILDKLEITHGT